MLPALQSILSWGWTTFSSSAAAAVTALKMEPGSNTSVTARFRHSSGRYCFGSLGLNAARPRIVERTESARTSPVLGIHDQADAAAGL